MLRVFSADDSFEVSAFNSVSTFFESWYVPAVMSNKRRKPISKLTIDRRRAAVAWWPRLMATPARPAGPLMGEITDESLQDFAERLKTATYSRGLRKIGLSPVSQTRTMEELMIVIQAAGPVSGRRMRAAILADPPNVYVVQHSQFPKPTWALDEARSLVARIATLPPPQRWTLTDNDFRVLMRATVALWFYTGHRARTYLRLDQSALVETFPGEWRLDIAASVKTGKLARVAIHARLLVELQALASLWRSSKRLIPWPIHYSAICKQYRALQSLAGFSKSRIMSPQAWRRLHSDQIAGTGFSMARSLAQQSLGHSSPAVTESHYSAIRDLAILRLPDIF